MQNVPAVSEDDMQKIVKLDMSGRLNTRHLWENVFSEDSREFVDYYYQQKIADNITYACESVPGGQPIAMLHLTPYQLEAGNGQLLDSFYIVGVATAPEYRHQGMMSEMLIRSMEDCRGNGIPFVFLMPADPLIYEPFGFRYIYERSEYEWKGTEEPYKTKVCGMFRLKEVAKEEYGALCSFANKYLREKTDYFVRRTVEYYDRLQEELKSQHGHMIGIYDMTGQFAGELLYAKEEKIYIQEMLCKQKDALNGLVSYCGKKPIIMARITNVTGFLKLFRAKEKEVRLAFSVKDALIPENCGTYYLEGNREGCKVTKTAWKEGALPVFGIEELVSIFFGRDDKLPVSKRKFFQDIAVWSQGCINEIV